MNKKVKTSILSTIFIFSSLCVAEKTFAKSNKPIISQNGITFSARSVMQPIKLEELLTSEKLLDLRKQKLDLLYEKNRLEGEKRQLEQESQNIKDTLKTLFREMERGQDFPNLYETWQEKLDNCLEQRNNYREKLKSYYSRYKDWKKRKMKFVEEVKRYKANI